MGVKSAGPNDRGRGPPCEAGAYVKPLITSYLLHRTQRLAPISGTLFKPCVEPGTMCALGQNARSEG